MWDDEDNNPYGSFDRRDSDTSPPESPTTRYNRPSSPLSDQASPQQQPPEEEAQPPRDEHEYQASVGEEPKKKANYESRVERLLYEHPNLSITITTAGKNTEGGGGYIVYTIRTHDLEVRRRYSDFYSLRQTLVNLHPTLIIPPIPEKHSVADYAAKPTKAKEDEAIIDHRKRMLTSFLNRCKRTRGIREDGVFWKFLDPHASWSEVVHSPPISTLPKSNLKVPPLDATHPTAGHNFLPIPAVNAKLKSTKMSEPSGTPVAQQSRASLPSAAAHTAAGPQIFGKFPPSTQQLSESDLDPYFVNFEQSSRELESILQGNVEKVNKRTLSHFNSYAEDLAELGARFNGFSLSEQSQTLAAAIEKMGQAVDSTYMATTELSTSLSAGFCEPMRESAQFASIVRNVLRYRILKRVQEEMTRDELEKKRALLSQLEFSELEAKRIDQHLESSGFVPGGSLPRRSQSTSSPRAERHTAEEDNASIDSDFPSGQAPPSAAQGAPSRSEPSSPTGSHRKSASGNFMSNKIFGRINHAINGMVDNNPERTRRDQIGKTKESLVQLEQALDVSVKDVKDASSGVLESLKEFQMEKENDLRRYMIAYAKAHIAWAKKNVQSWEEAKTEVESIQIQARAPLCQRHSYGKHATKATSDCAAQLGSCNVLFDGLGTVIHYFSLHIFDILPAHVSLDIAASVSRLCGAAYTPGAASVRQFLPAKTSFSKRRKLTYARHSSVPSQSHDLFAPENAGGTIDAVSPPLSSSTSASVAGSSSRSDLHLLPPHSQDHAHATSSSPKQIPTLVATTQGMTAQDDPVSTTSQDLSHLTSPIHRTASQIARSDRTIRAASPAKRSRAERDGDGYESDKSLNSMDIDGTTRSPTKKQNSAQTIQSPLPNRTKSIPIVEMPAQTSDSGNASVRGDVTTESVSSESNAVPASSPPTSVEMDIDHKQTPGPPSFDEQGEALSVSMQATLQEGHKGYIVPKAWLNKILAKATAGHGQQKENFSKEAIEARVGPIDTRAITLPSSNGRLLDEHGNLVTLLIPGCQLGGNIEVLTQECWDLVVGWYGLANNSKPIVRFVVNTNFEREGVPNLQYELYPILFSIQKLVNEPGQGLESIGDRGQKAAQLVASRTEKYQSFLKRAKAAVGIPLKQKVQLWKIVETLQANTGRAGIPTPMSSRSASPAPHAALATELPNLIMDRNTLTAMAENQQRELLDFPDETMNDKYNGSFRLGEIGFPEKQTIVIDSNGPSPDQPSTSNAKMNKKATETSSQSSATQAQSRPSANTRSAAADYNSNIFSSQGRRDRKGKTRGSVGLQNLGNTCYMNSALQCIRSVEELTAYFLKEHYKPEINTDNPLGHSGVMAKAYASLVSSIYGTDSSFSPRQFKNTIGRAQPLFSGYGQQDSQEFVGFLLDALHEDLNRIVKKPYVENPDSDDNRVKDPEYIKELGETYRKNHRQRNDSIAMDLFNGFYKNTMVCPVCDKVSVTFDPYSQVTLQLPVESTFAHKFRVYPLSGHPVTVDVDVDKNTSLRLVKEYIAERVAGVKADHLVFGEAYSHKLYKIFEDLETVGEASIASNDIIVAYELDDVPTNWPPLAKKKKSSFLGLSGFGASMEAIPEMSSSHADRMVVPVLNRVKSNGRTAFALDPFMIMITREEARDYEAILRKVLLKVNDITTIDIFRDCDFASAQQSGAEDVTAEDKTLPKIQARSVEGDEDFVDISMTDDPTARDGQVLETRSHVLDQRNYIPSEFRDGFHIGVYGGEKDVVPTAFQNISDNSHFSSLYDRAHPRDARRLSNGSVTSLRAGSRGHERMREGDSTSDISEDELAGSDNGMSLSTPDISVPADDESDSGNTSATEHSLTVKNSSLKRHGVRGSVKQSFRRMRDSMQRSKSRGKSDDYILKLGEGLILDWNPELFDSLFCGDSPDEMKGMRTDVDPELVHDAELENKRQRRALRKKNGVTLDECFDDTSKTEILSEDNAWYCPRCKDFRRAKKTLELWTVPDILIVHLKRFGGPGGRALSNKIDVLVDFPIEDLDLAGRVGLDEGKSLHYDLFAVDNHYGGLGGGHYTAFAKNFLDGKWYDFNDTWVSSVEPDQTVTKAAYLLFYRRRDPRYLGPPPIQRMVAEAMEATSSEDEEADDSGKDRTGDSTSSGSSEDSGLPGQRPRRLHGLGTGEQLSSQTQLTHDEGISMDDDPVESREGGATPPAIGIGANRSMTQSWNFSSLDKDGPAAPASSENGESDAGSVDSNEPNVSQKDLDDRNMTELGPIPFSSQMDAMPPTDDTVAEVHLSDHEEGNA